MEQGLRQRLVGAGVIIALGVIIIPVLLDGAGERQLRKIPDAPQPGMSSSPGFVDKQPIDMPAGHQNTQIVLTLPPDNVQDKAESQKTQSSPQKPQQKQKAKQSEAPTQKTVKAPAKTVDTKSADQSTTAKPKPKPVAKQTTQSKVNQTAKAESLKKPSVQKPPVVDKSFNNTTSADNKPGSQNWVVQVGSFTDAKKAVRLRDQLRKKSYKAFVEKIRGRSGQYLYRVRVGPLPKRGQADSLSAKLQNQGIKGFVTRHP